MSDRLRRRWFIPLVLAGLGLLIGFLYTLSARPVYSAETSIVLPVNQNQNRAGGLSALNVGGPDPTSVVAGYITSRQVREAVAAEMDMKLDELAAALTVEPVLTQSQIRVRLEGPDAEQAERGLVTMIAKLETLEDEILTDLGSNRASRLQEEIESAAEELREAEGELAEFQEKAQSNPLNDQAYIGTATKAQLEELKRTLSSVETEYQSLRQQYQAASGAPDDIPRGVESIDTLREQLRTAEIEWNQAAAIYQPSTPQYKKASEKLEAVRKALAKEVQAYYQSQAREINPRLAEVKTRRDVLANQVKQLETIARVGPNEAIELQRLLRAVTLAESKYKSLIQGLDEVNLMAKISSLRWTVLDPPHADPEPVNKRYAINMVALAGLGFLIGLALAGRQK